MISQLGQVMLYVEDLAKSAAFWTEILGFEVRARAEQGSGFHWIEVAPGQEAATTLVLHSREAVSKMAPELNLGTPSLMFFTPSVETLREALAGKGVTVGPVVARPDGKVFNFSDNEGHYFAVAER